MGTQTDFPDVMPSTLQSSVLEGACGSSIQTSSPKFDASDVDSDETKLDTPVKEFDPDATLNYSYKVSDEEGDSDATLLDTPQFITEKESDIHSESSGSSYIETYITDPSYTGPAYQSQRCSKHGASYNPPGWKKVMMKRRKLEFPETQD